MPNHCSSVSHHLAEPGQIPSGHLVYVDDTQPDHISVYMHPFHARSRLCWGLNQISSQQIGNGLWKGWAHESRAGAPAEGYRPASVRWEIIPPEALPRNRDVVTVEENGSIVWLIRERCITAALRDEMNEHLKRIAAGLFFQSWPHGTRQDDITASRGPLLASPILPQLV